MFLNSIARVFCASIALFFVVVLTSGCSSSNDGSTFPDEDIDVSPPVVRNFTPPEAEAAVLPTNTVFTVEFDELIDLQDLSSNVFLVSQKLRNINESFNFGSSRLEYNAIDVRELEFVHREELYTQIRSEVIRETVDEDGIVLQETEQFVSEVLASSLDISVSGRLPLSSALAIELGEGIKDRSDVQVLSPVDGTLTTGNFLVEPIQFGFFTADGIWQPNTNVNDAFQSNNNAVTNYGFSSTLTSGYVSWLQREDLGTDNSSLLVRRYNQVTQQYDLASTRIDYIPTIDTSSVSDEVLDFAASGSEGFHCYVWTYKESAVLQSVYYRCAVGDEYGERRLLATHPIGPEFRALSFVTDESGIGYISYIVDDVFYAYALSSVNGVPADVAATRVVGDVDLTINDASTNLVDSPNGPALKAILSTFEATASVSSRYKIEDIVFTADSYTNTVITSGDVEFEEISSGFDFLGRGFVGFVRGSGVNRGFYTVQFNSISWGDPVSTLTDGRGPMIEGQIFVFEDGQAIFAGVQQVGGTFLLKLQGSFPSDGAVRFARPPIIEQVTTLSRLENLQVIGDREGNAFVYYNDAFNVFAFRFVQNIQWQDAWSDPEVLVQYDGSPASMHPILEDGRMLLLSRQAVATYDALTSRVFSDTN